MTVFNQFAADDIVTANQTEVTLGLWTGDTGSLSEFYTSSLESSSLSFQYYANLYNKNPNVASPDTDTEVQFAVAYGHRLGGGGPTLAQNDFSTLATKAVYGQYRNLLLDPAETQSANFVFDGNYPSDHIYVVNIERARLKQKLDPGNWQISLSGSNGIRTFIDDSGQTLGATVGNAGRVFKVVSGTLENVNGEVEISTSLDPGGKGGFGYVYPDLGIIVLNPDAVSSSVGFTNPAQNAVSTITTASAPFAPWTASLSAPFSFQYNHLALVNSINLGNDFQARSAEFINSTHYFVRIKNRDYNYSNNPTFSDITTGDILNSDFIANPQVFVTTVGLYNPNNELLAVAKLSRPLQKSADREALIRCRLDF